MLTEGKIEPEKIVFDTLHESLDVLTSMLADVKKRQPIEIADELNAQIEAIMRGETPDKRTVERFDVDLNELTEKSEPLGEVASSEPESELGETEEKRAVWGERATDANARDTQELVRVRADLLNDLVNYAGEVNIYHARMGQQMSDVSFNLAELEQTVVRLKEQLRNLEIETEIQIRSNYRKEADQYGSDFDPLEMDRYSTLQALSRSLSETAGDVESINGIIGDIVRNSETLLLQESRVSTELQEGLMRTRMVRFGGLGTRLRRIVRQTAKELGKDVELEIKGDTSEVDRTVLDRIVAPLEHMLRNAVAHGIEKPEDRVKLGKPETGAISISVYRHAADVVIHVQDDGSGMDAKAIRKKAIERGLMNADSNLSDRDVLQFILKAGFSTAAEVTQVAGRGVGMDVVDSEIKQLGGLLEIDTVPGKGTLFKIRLPLTLAINQALLVNAADDVYAVPLASIEGVVRVTGAELQGFYDSDQKYYQFNNVKYELLHLGKLLTGIQGDYTDQHRLFPVLLAKVGEHHYALHVDDLVGRREIVVKPVGLQIGLVRGIAGATILADGRVVLILEMSALVVGENLWWLTTRLQSEK
jgi:chemosensory pili system protein ChpA (sensor histidine kinase/response regulator)